VCEGFLDACLRRRGDTSFPRRRESRHPWMPAFAGMTAGYAGVMTRHSRVDGNPGLLDACLRRCDDASFPRRREFRHPWMPAFAGMTAGHTGMTVRHSRVGGNPDVCEDFLDACLRRHDSRPYRCDGGVIPAQAGIQVHWMPACAGMTAGYTGVTEHHSRAPTARKPWPRPQRGYGSRQRQSSACSRRRLSAPCCQNPL
jgi:hypothetical protein